MIRKRKTFTIPFILYPAICTLMAGVSASEWSAQILLTPLVAVVVAGVSLFPLLLLIERLHHPQNLIWREAQTFGILITGMLALGSVMALVLQQGFGVMSWELIFYSKPIGAYIICSLCYLTCSE